MDIQQLRGWADVMDKALVISAVMAVLSIAALGVSAWFSVRFAVAMRAQQSASFDQYKGEAGRHAAQLEASAAQAAERIVQLEGSIADADNRAAQARRDSARATEFAAAKEREAAEARRRVAELEQLVRPGARPAQTDKPAAVTPPPETRSDARPEIKPPEARTETKPEIAKLVRFTGTKVAIYALEEASDGANLGSAVSSLLTDAGWEAATWRWAGVSGILGVVILTREGSDAATEEAASALLEVLRASGYNAAKGNWPADWRRFRGALHGPQTPAPTDALIRIVIGDKAR